MVLVLHSWEISSCLHDLILVGIVLVGLVISFCRCAAGGRQAVMQQGGGRGPGRGRSAEDGRRNGVPAGYGAERGRGHGGSTQAGGHSFQHPDAKL